MSATVHPARVWPAGPGRSAFWINWQGGMTPCGMMTQPLFSVPELGFAQAMGADQGGHGAGSVCRGLRGLRLKEICPACAAMCVTETGHFDAKPEYVCEMTHETVRRTIEEVKMEIRKQLVKRNIAGDVILVPIGDASLELKGLVTLNETGELLWDRLPQAADAADLAAALRAEYDVDEPRRCRTHRRSWTPCGS